MKKIAPGLWVPNSERGHKMQSLEGENEIPHIAFLDFLAKMSFLAIWGQIDADEI